MVDEANEAVPYSWDDPQKSCCDASHANELPDPESGGPGERFFFEADTVVLAVGMDANEALSQELQGQGKKVYVVGDAAQPRKIIDAVYDGARVGREI